jgi:hypothetical protein
MAKMILLIGIVLLSLSSCNCDKSTKYIVPKFKPGNIVHRKLATEQKWIVIELQDCMNWQGKTPTYNLKGQYGNTDIISEAELELEEEK